MPVDFSCGAVIVASHRGAARLGWPSKYHFDHEVKEANLTASRFHERINPIIDTNGGVVLVGPFWTRSKVIHDLGCSADSLLHRSDVPRIGARMSQEVYPAFQFEDHHYRRDLGTVVEMLVRYDVTGAVICSWLVDANADLGGTTPLDWLRRNRSEKAVVDSARRSIEMLQAASTELRSHEFSYERHCGLA